MPLLDRRRFAGWLAAAALLIASPRGAAQKPGRVYRIGVLRPTTADTSDFLLTLLPRALREEGYVEGRNLVLVHRYADYKLDRLPLLARELVAERVDVIFAVGSGATRAARQATSTIPIVF